MAIERNILRSIAIFYQYKYLRFKNMYDKINMQKQEEFTCEFCSTKFKYNSTLKNHVKTAKFCLDIQNKVEINYKKFICDYCHDEFKAKRNLQSHFLICKQKLIFDTKNDIKNDHSDEIKLLKEKHLDEIKILKEKYIEEINDQKIYIASLVAKLEIYEKDHNVISDIAKQTKITNTNNIVNNLAIYDVNKIAEHFSNKLEYITKEDIINGQKGIANILAPCLYDENGNKMLTCTDKSRLMFTKLDNKNNKIKDSELKDLASLIKPLALKKADEIVEEHNKLKEKIYNIDNLKIEIEEYKSYIKNFQNIIDGNKHSNTHHKMILEYENKINKYEQKIKQNADLILKYIQIEKISSEDIEDENEKLLDGHTEIQYLDKESTKFARHIAKLM